MPELEQVQAEVAVEAQRVLMEQVNAFVQSQNLAVDMDDDLLREVGEVVYRGYEIDETSREDWLEANEEIFELAKQLGGKKTYRGESVSNVKYPIITTAAMQFSARASANIVKGNNVVKCQIVGSDPEGVKAQRGVRVRQHMSYQMLEQMDSWEEDMDQLLMSLPLVGAEFKKTYYNGTDGKPVSELVMAEDLVIKYNAKSLEKAPRITHILELYPNDIEERIRSGVFLDHDYDKMDSGDKGEEDSDSNNDDDDNPTIYLEQHFRYDLDDDGYKEPIIVTIHKSSKEVVRIAARFDIDGVSVNEAGDIVRIIPINYFTRFLFLPSFDGGVYGMGFGALLAPLTQTVNTTINQLLDAGTLANRQGGFIGRGVKITKGNKTGSMYFKQGEWRMVQSSGEDLRKGIVPLPVKEPSNVLFSLLGLMLEASKELASQADVLTGEHPKGNVPATTTLALIEQGLKVFSAIYMRTYRSLKSEFKKIRRLNMMYLGVDEYNNIIDSTEMATVQNPQTGEPMQVRQPLIVDPKEDYGDRFMDIIPVSGAADVSDTQRIMKSSALLEMMGTGLNDDEIKRRHLEALGIDDIQSLLPPEGSQPPEDPKIKIEEGKLELKSIELQLKNYELDMKERETEGKILKLWADSVNALAKAEAAEAGPQLEIYKNNVAAYQARLAYRGQVDAALAKPQGGSGGDNKGTA